MEIILCSFCENYRMVLTPMNISEVFELINGRETCVTFCTHFSFITQPSSWKISKNFESKISSTRKLYINLCTPVSSVTRRQSLSQELLCRVPHSTPLDTRFVLIFFFFCIDVLIKIVQWDTFYFKVSSIYRLCSKCPNSQFSYNFYNYKKFKRSGHQWPTWQTKC